MMLKKYICVVFNNKCISHLHLSRFPLALTVSTMLRGGVKINGCSLTLSDSILTSSSAVCFQRVIID